MFGSGKVTKEGHCFGIFFIFAVFCIAVWLFAEMYNPHSVDCTVTNVQLVTDVQGSDGTVTTTVYYMVTTDKGLFKLKTNGINAASGIISKVEAGNSYLFEVRGIEFPFFGMYANIVHVY